MNIKALATLLLFLFTFSASHAQFKGHEWGTKKTELIEEKGTPDNESSGMLFYKGSVADYSAIIWYQFFNDELHAGGYVFTESHSNEMLYTDDFDEVNTILIKKYGVPKDSDPRIVFDTDTESNQ